jgi:hypothetical protein
MAGGPSNRPNNASNNNAKKEMLQYTQTQYAKTVEDAERNQQKQVGL